MAALARPGGRLYLHDIHPVAWALADESPTFAYTYFEEHEPYVDDSGETYTDAERALVNTRTYEWNHSIGEVVTALIDRGMRHRPPGGARLDGRPAVPLAGRDRPRPLDHGCGSPRLPLSYTLVATRTA